MKPGNKPKNIRTISLDAALGGAVILVMVSFVIGNRWTDIKGYVSGRTSVNQSLPADLDYTEVEQVYDLLRANFDGELSLEDLLDGLKEGLARASNDRYTVYLSEEESNEFLSELNGSFTGIGAELGLDENNRLIVVAPLDGFPAQKSGVRAGDMIIKINGEDSYNLSVEEAVLKIRGPAETDVTLTLFRDGKTIELTITRAEITVPSVTSEVNDGIGILRISRFAEDTVRLSREAAESFIAQDVDGVILDLRNNTGGYLGGAVDVASLWLDNQVVVEEKRGDTTVDTLSSQKGSILGDTPTVILINEGSASASEIVAGALKDHNKATLIGVTTFGKGSVQELKEIKSGGTLKVTIARWYTPNGNNIDETGIEPDQTVEITEEDIENGVDPQLDAAKKYLR